MIYFCVYVYVLKQHSNNTTTISKSTIQDSLTILDTTDFIEEKFPQLTKLNFPENFLVGSNLSIADLANASYFLNSLNKRRIQKLKDLDKLSNKNNIMSKINIKIIDELKLEPLSLIKQLEKMPELDLVSLSSSINKTSSSILKNTDIVMNNSFWIGVYPGLGEEELCYTVDKIKEFINKNN